jgi:hypothetical protein
MGCLKLDCTFAHLRPRPNMRSPSTPRRKKTCFSNLKFILFLPASTTNLVNKEAIKLSPVINSPSTPIQLTNESIPSPQINPPETIPNRIPVPAEIERPKSPIRNSPETPSRTVGNRNVVIAESSSIPTRTVVHGTTNRVVVPSTDTDSDIDLDDLIEQENQTINSKE